MPAVVHLHLIVGTRFDFNCCQ